MDAAEVEFLAARIQDVKQIANVSGLNEVDSLELLNISLQLLVRGQDLEGDGPLEQSLKVFFAKHRLNSKKMAIYNTLASSATAHARQYGQTVDEIFSANSFDMYRALGLRTEVVVILDTSVAMPVLFGLAFGAAKSRYGVAALALKAGCEAHNIKIVVPRAYLNEMASHGQRALEKLDIYNSFSTEARIPFKASENAYLSHFTHVAETVLSTGGELTLIEFLEFFGISPGRSLSSIENRIETLFDQHGIRIAQSVRYDRDLRDEINAEKLKHPPILIDHDAIVATMLRNDTTRGYVFATWDKVMINVVEKLARIYADRPGRVIDFLSMSRGQVVENEQNYELLSTLLHIDGKVAAKLAAKMDQIKSVEQAFRLDKFITDARSRFGEKWELFPEDVAPFIDEPVNEENFISKVDAGEVQW